MNTISPSRSVADVSEGDMLNTIGGQPMAEAATKAAVRERMVDFAATATALQVLFEPGTVVELRVLGAARPGYWRPHTESGYFNDWSALAAAAGGIPAARGWYVTINPVVPALLARAANRVKPSDTTTSDKDIACRRWLPIDLDAVRPSEISSNEDEHTAVLAAADAVRRELATEGWPEPIVADSGNGAHLLFRVNLPADDGGLVARVLKALATRFNPQFAGKVTIDVKVGNAARIWKLYGTRSCKGDSTADRPHRMAQLLRVPSCVEIVPKTLLEAMAATAPADPVSMPRSNGHRARFNLDRWIVENKLDVSGPRPWRDDGRIWVFPVCPWNPEHTNGSAFIVQYADGKIGAGCHHNGCAGKHWHELRDVVEPGWRARRSSNGRPPAKTARAKVQWASSTTTPADNSDMTATDNSVADVRIDLSLITNQEVVQVENEGSEPKAEKRPLAMQRVLALIGETTHDWPRRVGNALFIHDPSRGVCWLDRPAALFGYLAARTGVIEWARGSGYASKEEVTAELQRTATAYEAISELPHEPELPNTYYACQTPEPGDGTTVNAFLDYFCFEAPIDRQLGLATLATPGWGGHTGARPAGMFTALKGRGRGKSKAAQLFARVWGGYIDISANDDIANIKARLLSPEAMSKRVCLLDNVKTAKFSWAELESLITTDIISGKRMYVGEASRPNHLLWLITLNGPGLSADLAQRIVEIRLGEPQYSDAWEQEVLAFIRDHQQALIADLIGVLRRPRQKLSWLSRWATWESEVLARVDDAEQCLETIQARRREADVDAEQGEVVEDYFRQQLLDLGFDPDRADVFIPGRIAARWFNAATGENYKTVGVTRSIKQGHAEGRIHRIVPHRGGAEGSRGCRWIGNFADANDAIDFSLTARFRNRMAELGKAGEIEL